MRQLLCVLVLLAMPLQAPAQGQIEGVVTPHPARVGILVHLDAPHEPLFLDVDSAGRYHAEGVPIGLAHLTIRGFGYFGDSATVTVRDGVTTHHDFVMRVDSGQVIRRHEQWLHCDGRSAPVRCVTGRHVLGDRTHFRDTTAWVFADSLAFAAFLLQHPSNRLSPLPEVPVIDWTQEAVVAVSYGARTGCHPFTYVNRVEYHARATIVWLGPDSTFIGPQGITCQALWATADIVVIPAPHEPVVFRTIAPEYPRPPAMIHRPRQSQPQVPNDR